LKKPGVLTSPVPTSVSRLQQWSKARKGAVNRAALDKAVQSTIVSRRIVRVRCAWCRRYGLNSSPQRSRPSGSHDKERELSGHGRVSACNPSSQLSRATTDAWWERARRAPTRIASLPHRKRGIALAGLSDQARVLYGNGVAIVPKVHAVMAWAARKILVAKEREADR
jgi:hypothetical protein